MEDEDDIVDDGFRGREDDDNDDRVQRHRLQGRRDEEFALWLVVSSTFEPCTGCVNTSVCHT